MDISIIILNYNTKELTKKCIESVIDEGSKLIKEIIVVDNASKDGSVEMLRNLWKKSKEITLIENRQNVGFSRGVNQAMEKSSGEFILLLNSDTQVRKGDIYKLVSFAKSKKDAGVVGAKLINDDGTVQQSCMNFPTIWGAFREYWLGVRHAFTKFTPKSKQATKVDTVVGAVFLITPSALEKVGKLNEDYFMFFEDVEYCRMIAEAGLKTYYLPSVEVLHSHGASGRNIVDEMNQWRRLIPSSKTYHGELRHLVITFILWSAKKWQTLKEKVRR